MKNDEQMPAARKDDLLVSLLDSGEKIVYDRTRDKAHCLNPTVATIWGCCDGRMAVSEAARMVAEAHSSPDDRDVVFLGLDQLRRAHLVEDEAHASVAMRPTTSRRDLVRRFGTAAAVAISLPLVSSIIAPTSAEAASCVANGGACSTGFDCCSRKCVSGMCAA